MYVKLRSGIKYYTFNVYFYGGGVTNFSVFKICIHFHLIYNTINTKHVQNTREYEVVANCSVFKICHIVFNILYIYNLFTDIDIY